MTYFATMSDPDTTPVIIKIIHGVRNKIRLVQDFVKRIEEEWTASINKMKRPRRFNWDWRDDWIYDDVRFHLLGHKSIRHWKHLKDALFKKDEEWWWVPPTIPNNRPRKMFYLDLLDEPAPKEPEKELSPEELREAALRVANLFKDDDEAGPSERIYAGRRRRISDEPFWRVYRPSEMSANKTFISDLEEFTEYLRNFA